MSSPQLAPSPTSLLLSPSRSVPLSTIFGDIPTYNNNYYYEQQNTQQHHRNWVCLWAHVVSESCKPLIIVIMKPISQIVQWKPHTWFTISPNKLKESCFCHRQQPTAVANITYRVYKRVALSFHLPFLFLLFFNDHNHWDCQSCSFIQHRDCHQLAKYTGTTLFTSPTSRYHNGHSSSHTLGYLVWESEGQPVAGGHSIIWLQTTPLNTTDLGKWH